MQTGQEVREDRKLKDPPERKVMDREPQGKGEMVKIEVGERWRNWFLCAKKCS
jgi:hypothetical protein